MTRAMPRRGSCSQQPGVVVVDCAARGSHRSSRPAVGAACAAWGPLASRVWKRYNIAFMPKPSTRPRPCADPDCRGRHSPRERVALAESICERRGVRMTELRRGVLELLWASGGPTTAYQLIEAVKLRDSRPVGPPTVYRALGFLMSQGLVSRIESLNAYVPCAHPERAHDCLFFICGGCRTSVELEGSADRRAACRGCRRPRVRRDTAHGRGRGQVRTVRGSRCGVGAETQCPDGPRRLNVSAVTRPGTLA